jgi:hypothetical protein
MAGKSTFINAILGKEIASTNFTQETASLTKFRSADKDFIRVSFYNKEDWKELWDSVDGSSAKVLKKDYHELNARKYESEWIGREDRYEEYDNENDLVQSIKSWISVKSAIHYFVKEIEVGLKKLNIFKGVVFIDTPDLDDPVKYRSDITRIYIERADVVLFCVDTKTLTDQKLKAICNVIDIRRYKIGSVFVIAAQIDIERVFVVGKQIDMQYQPVKEEKDIIDAWLKFLGNENCYNDPVLAQRNFIVVNDKTIEELKRQIDVMFLECFWEKRLSRKYRIFGKWHNIN